MYRRLSILKVKAPGDFIASIRLIATAGLVLLAVNTRTSIRARHSFSPVASKLRKEGV